MKIENSEIQNQPENISDSIEISSKDIDPSKKGRLNTKLNNALDYLDERIKQSYGLWGSKDPRKSKLSRIAARYPEELNKTTLFMLRELTKLAVDATGGKRKEVPKEE